MRSDFSLSKTFRSAFFALAIALTLLASPAWSRYSSGRPGRSTHQSTRVRTYTRKSGTVVRYRRAAAGTRIQRSRAAPADFQRSYPCPPTGRTSGACPGYVVDRVKPLACSEERTRHRTCQWQTTAAAKAKDKWERLGCK
jgi:hypothetical protein